MAKKVLDETGKEVEKPFGRPREWTNERLKDAAKHLNEYLDRAKKDKSIFWWKDWCFDYGMLPSQCARFSERCDDFRQAYIRACEWQEQTVVKYALAKKFADNFSQFYLRTQHRERWKEKEDANVSEGAIAQFNAIVAMLDSRQAKSDLAISEINSKAETKS